MTNKEALEIIQQYHYGNAVDSSKYMSAMDLVEFALERAVPKKPFVEPYFYGKYYRCPACGRMVEKNKCCSNNDCRQRINWKEA